jgi:hypothetical protein
LHNTSEEAVDISLPDGENLNGLIRFSESNERWVLVCRGLTGNLTSRSSLDELTDQLGDRQWTSFRFDYTGTLITEAYRNPRTRESMIRDVTLAISSLVERLQSNPTAVVARGYGSSLALQTLTDYPDIPIVMWSPILWLRTSLELRGRLHQLRRGGRLEFDKTVIGEDFVKAINDPSDDEVRKWINPDRRHIIVHGETDEVTPLWLVQEAKALIESAGGRVLLVTVQGGHPHPGEDVKIQIEKIVEVLSLL